MVVVDGTVVVVVVVVVVVAGMAVVAGVVVVGGGVAELQVNRSEVEHRHEPVMSGRSVSQTYG